MRQASLENQDHLAGLVHKDHLDQLDHPESVVNGDLREKQGPVVKLGQLVLLDHQVQEVAEASVAQEDHQDLRDQMVDLVNKGSRVRGEKQAHKENGDHLVHQANLVNKDHEDLLDQLVHQASQAQEDL